MLIYLQNLVTTTPKIRAEIQESDKPARVLAERYGTTDRHCGSGASETV